MISVEEAKQAVIDNTFFLERKKRIAIYKALGHYTAEEISSPLNLPSFDQSNVDGFAVRFSANKSDSYTVHGEIKAGDTYNSKLLKGQTVRIFTGAMVPKNADAVVMQEAVDFKDDNIVVKKNPRVKKGDYIRRMGSQILKGEIAMKQKTLLTPGAIGFLCAMGLEKVRVFDKPLISLVVTGNELQNIGTKLKSGKVFDSNSHTIISAVESAGFKVGYKKLVKDKKDKLKTILRNALRKSDLLIVSGGVSVGKYDIVEEVLEALGVKTIFHNVSQRPGKPLYFGRYKNTIVFGLPGNPSSALTCYYEYVLPALNKMTGNVPLFLPSSSGELLNDLNTVPHLSYYVRGRITGKGVEALEGFESYKMKAYSEADCLIYFPKGKELWQSGEIVEVHLLNR